MGWTTGEKLPAQWEAERGRSERVGDSEIALAFSDPLAEYGALRREAGHYDLSSCGRLLVAGSHALQLVQTVVTRDVQYLLPETCLMALMLDDDGLIKDVVTVFVLEDGSFELQTSLGFGSASLEQLAGLVSGEVVVSDGRRLRSAVAIEGPATWSVLDRLGLQLVIDLPFLGVRSATLYGQPIRVARTGVTGEFGVEIIGAPDVIDVVLGELAALCPRVGLLALEAAMLEVRHPVPWRECVDVGASRAGVRWLVDFQKQGYVGQAAVLEEVETSSVGRVGFAAATVEMLTSGAQLSTRDGVVGEVVWSAFSPSRAGCIGVAELRADLCVPGLRLSVEDPAIGLSTIETLSSPLVVPGSWAVVAAERAAQDDVEARGDDDGARE